MSLTQAILCEKDFEFRIAELEHSFVSKGHKISCSHFVDALAKHIREHLMFTLELIDIQSLMSTDPNNDFVALTITIMLPDRRGVATVKHTLHQPKWLAR